MAAQVGLDPHNDISWVPRPDGKFMAPFADGEVDAFLAFPPEPQELRARRVGRVILNTTTDKPWSQYFCCVSVRQPGSSSAHIRSPPSSFCVPFKAADMCATEPQWAAERLVDAGFTGRYEYALQALTEVPYTVWRYFDAEDSMRFYALRLHESA
jgi:NitT/TauT family transport system substrate-binding protein